ncbi:39S ribosomal protein L54, mitochondrial [Strigops habroptila]|uniref:39S ribosomal protein L54, mitochondrial n=1 Tax=Strigops habroptila TaxID=2489341 RepID=UPI0011CED3E3|nr:39S ribosomal protein L54, mitochondrial [Strigops habroptila]
MARAGPGAGPVRAAHPPPPGHGRTRRRRPPPRMRCPAPPGGPRPSERSAYPGASPSRLRPSRRAPRAHHGGPGAATAAGGAPGPARGYAKKPAMKAKGKSVPKEGLKAPEVCTDPAMLATYAMGVNYFKDGPRWPEARHPSTRTGSLRSTSGLPRSWRSWIPTPSSIGGACGSTIRGRTTGEEEQEAVGALGLPRAQLLRLGCSCK